MQFNIEQINNDWTLFIDRDGVINHEKKDDYIKTVEEFKFYDGVLAALAMLSGFFKTIVLVTNQKGVGRGLMTEADLAAIHAFMLAEIQQAGGRIDAIFYCTDTAADSPNRKPNPGMAFQAKQQLPHINFSQSVMVGNKLSDMGFGRNAGINTVFVATTNPEVPFPHPAIDVRCSDLLAFAQLLASQPQ